MRSMNEREPISNIRHVFGNFTRLLLVIVDIIVNIFFYLGLIEEKFKCYFVQITSNVLLNSMFRKTNVKIPSNVYYIPLLYDKYKKN